MKPETRAKKELIKRQPHMSAANSLEFRQRLQWLSEGMLKNHIDGVTMYEIDNKEIADYQTYKNETKQQERKQ